MLHLYYVESWDVFIYFAHVWEVGERHSGSFFLSATWCCVSFPYTSAPLSLFLPPLAFFLQNKTREVEVEI